MIVTDNVLPDTFRAKLFKTHVQGAIVRSVASLIMWLFAVFAFWVDDIQVSHFIGISCSVLFLVLINPPTLFILKRIVRKKVFANFSLFINMLEVVGYTAIIYSTGGFEATFLTPIYAALIAYLGVVAPSKVPFIIASFCAFCYGLVVALDGLGIMPSLKVDPHFNPSLANQFIRVSVVIGLLFTIAYISTFTAGKLKQGRNRLRQQNKDLEDKTIQLENSRRELSEAHKGLEAIVAKLQGEIAERKRMEQVLQESEERHRTLHDASFGGTFIHENGILLDCNQGLSDISGYSRDELIGTYALNKLIAPDWRETVLRNYKSGFEQPYEVEGLRKDGTIYPLYISGRNIPFKGRMVRAVEYRDITEMKRAEEALRESEEKLARSKKMESLGLLAGGVAHDLNNILSGIISYPELILMELPEDSKFRKPIETIMESGHRAADIVQDLLTVARGVAISRRPLNINDLIDDYLHSPEFNKIQQLLPTVTVKTNLEVDLFNISGSHVHIRKVVMNLVSNAAEAIKSSGQVTISTMNRYMDRPLRGYDDVKIGEYVVLSVSDDGSGIASNDLERIFEPFYTKKVMGRSGTGLGLAVVWNIVQDHKGYIDVITDENGTTFELYFPITREELSVKEMTIPIKDYKGNGETILVVDDMESQRDIALRMLDKLGYQTKTVSSGEEAVEYLKENTVDLILLDMIMDPDMDGRETFERIIEIHPKQKAIIVSGFAVTDVVKATQKLGAGKYIKKPYTIETIGLAVKEELGK